MFICSLVNLLSLLKTPLSNRLGRGRYSAIRMGAPARAPSKSVSSSAAASLHSLSQSQTRFDNSEHDSPSTRSRQPHLRFVSSEERGLGGEVNANICKLHPLIALIVFLLCLPYPAAAT